MKYKKILLIALFVFLVASGYFYSNQTIDPDLGWHFKAGELILERGIPYQDWFSHSMPNFPWINHEWLGDIAFFKINSVFGFDWLLIGLISLFTISFFIVGNSLNHEMIAKEKNINGFSAHFPRFWLKSHKNLSDYRKGSPQNFSEILPQNLEKWGEKSFRDSRKKNLFSFVFPIILGFFASLTFLGVRPQLLTVFFVAVFWFLIIRFLEKDSKLIFFAPLIFILWANLHASFFAGLFILAIILSLELFKKFRYQIISKLRFLEFINRFKFEEQSFYKIKVLACILVLSSVAALLNPYGARLYGEIFSVVGDNYLRFHIAEWTPLYFTGFKPFITLYICFFVAFLAVFYKKIEFNKFVLSIVFLALTISGIRYFLIFVILTAPVFSELLEHFAEKVQHFNYNLLKKAAFIITFAFILALPIKTIFLKDKSFSLNYYPRKEAIEFIKTLPLAENMFNEYGWGGNLILNIPERKYFIDGRMPSWRENGRFVFGDYNTIRHAREGFEDLIAEYDIKLVFIRNIKTENQKIEANLAKRFPFLDKIFKISENRDLTEELLKMGWKEIYKDDRSIILSVN